MDKEHRLEEALRKISRFKENWEDYYGGVSMNYAKMVNDIIEIANTALLNYEPKRTRCHVQMGCCEAHPETAYNLYLNDLKKVIPEDE